MFATVRQQLINFSVFFFFFLPQAFLTTRNILDIKNRNVFPGKKPREKCRTSVKIPLLAKFFENPRLCKNVK